MSLVFVGGMWSCVPFGHLERGDAKFVGTGDGGGRKKTRLPIV